MIGLLINLSAIVYWILVVLRWGLCLIWGSVDPSNEISARGKVVLITGANAGIGKVTALEFAKRDAAVILACRDIGRAEEAVNWIRKRTSLGQLTCMQLDLANLQSVRDFCKEFQARYDRLDFLINNAGVALPTGERRTTIDGFELHMGVNHLGHFLLTNLLLDVIKKSAPSRIVTVSSMTHAYRPLNLEDIMSEKEEPIITIPFLEPSVLYSRSKLANMLFSKELGKRLEGSGVNSYALCPGVVATDIMGRSMKGIYALIFALGWPIFNFVAKSPKGGAATTVYCALNKGLEHSSGEAYQHCRYWHPKDRDPVLKDEDAKFLWDQSTKLVGL